MEQLSSVCIRGYRTEEGCETYKNSSPKKIEQKDDPALVNIGTLGKLCRELNIKELHRELQRRYPDKCYDLTATIAYLGRLRTLPSEYSISVLTKNQFKLKYDRFPIMLHEFGNWDEVCNFTVFKNPKMSNIETLLAIILRLTYQGWPDGYYQWLNINIDNITVGEFNEVVKRKTGL